MLNSKSLQEHFTADQIALVIDALNFKVRNLQEEICTLRRIDSVEFRNRSKDASKKCRLAQDEFNRGRKKTVALTSKDGRNYRNYDYESQDAKIWRPIQGSNWWQNFYREKPKITSKITSIQEVNGPSRYRSSINEAKEVFCFKKIRDQNYPEKKKPYVKDIISTTTCRVGNNSKSTSARKRTSKGVQCNDTFWMDNYKMIFSSQDQKNSSKVKTKFFKLKRNIQTQLLARKRSEPTAGVKSIQRAKSTCVTREEPSTSQEIKKARAKRHSIQLQEMVNTWEKDCNPKDKIADKKKRKFEKKAKEKKKKKRHTSTQTEYNKSVDVSIKNKKKVNEMLENKKSNKKKKETKSMNGDIKFNKSEKLITYDCDGISNKTYLKQEIAVKKKNPVIKHCVSMKRKLHQFIRKASTVK